MGDLSHGEVGTREQPFTSILPATHSDYSVAALADLAIIMKSDQDKVHDGPDPEENLWVPAGYTYFGQFIDHDLTFDSTSTLNPDDTSVSTNRMPSNLRSPRFDLDCVYGDGPDAQPFMYDSKGEKLLLGGPGIAEHDDPDHPGITIPVSADNELARAQNGRAIIGDKRNDENSIVNQIQQGFIRYHNLMVDRLIAKHPKIRGFALFEKARDEVRWTYQRLVLEDFLPRIIQADVLADLERRSKKQREHSYVFYTKDKRANLPREFVAAAYRFGHSGVRFGYRLNDGRFGGPIKTGTIHPIFNPSVPLPAPDDDSLIGFEPLPKHHLIDDWSRFFSDSDPTQPDSTDDRGRSPDIVDSSVKLQFAYKLDTSLVDPLGVLPMNVASAKTTDETKKTLADLNPRRSMPDPKGRPSLALLNLLRGNIYKLHGGQAYASMLASKFPKASPLDKKYLVVRISAGDKKFQFKSIDVGFHNDTPLWFYILAEAQIPVVDYIRNNGGMDQSGNDVAFSENLLLTGDGAKTQLGYVGGRIVAEVMYGLMDSDDDSVMGTRAEKWLLENKDRKMTMLSFLNLPGMPPQAPTPA